MTKLTQFSFLPIEIHGHGDIGFSEFGKLADFQSSHFMSGGEGEMLDLVVGVCGGVGVCVGVCVCVCVCVCVGGGVCVCV